MKSTLFSRRNITFGVLAIAAICALAAFAGHPVIPPELFAGIGALPFAASGEVTSAEIKSMLETQGKTFEEFKKTNDELLKAKAEGKAVSDLEAKLQKLDTKLTDLDEAKAAIDEIMKKMNRPGNDLDAKSAADRKEEVRQFNLQRKSIAAAAGKVADGLVEDEAYASYKSAFIKLARGGKDPLSGDEIKALQSGVDSDGGYLLPANIVGRTVSRIFETSPMRQLATVQPISTEAMEGLNDNDEAGFGWVGETAPRPETNTPQVGKWKIEAHEMYAAPKATQKLLDDAAVDVEAWLAQKVADRFTRGENNAFVVGNGVAKPRGFLDYPSAQTADDTRPWGTLEFVKSGANGAFAGANAGDALIDLVGSLKDGYKANATFVTRREVITAVRKFKDGQGQYLWQPSLVLGTPDQLMSFPVVKAADMPALGANSLSLAFGDFREGYLIVDRIGIRVLRDPYTNKPYVIFYTTKRTGGGVLNFEAIKLMKFTA